MGTSKPRKHGHYLGGRPFPLVAPICRVCQRGAPDAFYNSRGIENICHKRLRRAGRINEWPDVPVMLRDGSLRQIQKNPLKWLRNNMSDSHAQTIPAHLYELECWRIIHVMACRWYGETVYLDPIRPSQIADVVWARQAESESEDHAPIYDVEGVAKERRLKATRTKQALSSRDPQRYAHIVNIIRPFVTQSSARGLHLPRPKVFIVPGYWMAIWPIASSSLVLRGALNSPPAWVGVQDNEDEDGDDYIEFNYSGWETFRLAWEICSDMRQAADVTVATC